MGRLAGSWDPAAWGGSWARLLLAASVLGSCLQPVPAQLSIVITPQSPAVGGAVSLAPQPPQNLTLCKWYRAANTEDDTRRIFTYSTAQINGPAHTGRETAGPGCALNIAGLMLSDTGNYTVLMDLSDGSAPTLRVNLPVYEMLPKPTVTPDHILMPENGTFNLTCNSSLSANTLLWLRNESYLVPSERLELSPGNQTLTVLNFTQGDAGAYQCEVRNLVSTNRSEPSTVTLAYGPDSASIDLPGPIGQPLGSSLTLTCIADSIPAPSYRWFLNGIDTNETRSSCTFNLTTADQLGIYECRAHNPVTGFTASVKIEVLEMLPKPMVTPSQTHVLENGTFNLTCNNSSPTANTLLWLRNASYLTTDQRLELSSDNRTLTVLNVTRNDTGSYQCEVTNPVSTNRSEPSTVTVAYGPDSARIYPPGPITQPLGSSLTLTCVADSVPPSRYHWVHNGNDTNENGSSWTINPMTGAQQGTFTCQAHNPNTNLTAWASVTVQVTDSDSPSTNQGASLSAGAIAGIVIGSLAGAALVGGLLYFLLCKTGGGPEHRAPLEGPAAPTHNQGVGDNKPTLGNEEIQYSALAFASGDQKPSSGPPPLQDSGTSTVYSEIRKK